MSNKKQRIEVRQYHGDSTHLEPKFDVIETIEAKLHVDQVGNFNRIACKYKGKTYLVHSDAGDLGDPFRADESYLKCLFIKSGEPCQWNLP